MANTANRYDELPKPGYEIVKELVNEDDGEGNIRKLTLIKLSKPLVGRFVGKPKYADFDHVVIASVSLQKEDEYGTFSYRETTVCGSEDDGTIQEAILYLSLATLSVEEALFAIGEI